MATIPVVRPADGSPLAARLPIRGVREVVATLGLRRPRILRGPRMASPVDAPTLHTQRLILRPYRMTDAEAWFGIQSDPEVLRQLDWPARGRAESLRHLKDRTRHTRLWQADDFLALAIECGGHLIGDVSLHLRTISAETRSAEIGWVLASDYTGEGYAREASNAMLDFAFGALRAHRVEAMVHPYNHRSLNLAACLGFAEARRDAAEISLAITPEQRIQRG